VPLARWFRGPLRERVTQTVLGPRLESTGLFSPRYLNELVASHLAGVRDYSAPLWSLLMFDAFLANVMQEPLPQPRESAVA
jgi:asparagine synthase (glutamine-hydrolysing)